MNYKTHTEYNPRTDSYRKKLIPGHRIRVDVPTGQLCKVQELHSCRNWRLVPGYGHTDHTSGISTYYIDILN